MFLYVPSVCAGGDPGDDQVGPPPYHIAAVHSRLAGEFASSRPVTVADRRHPLSE